MNINKLTITPIMSGMPSFSRQNPSTEIACQLIKERLICGSNNSTPKFLKKLPKALRGWVNPECKIVPNVKTDFYA